MPGRIEIDDVRPVVSCGRYPAKAVVGEMVPVQATVWREGHEAVAARWWSATWVAATRDLRVPPTVRWRPAMSRGREEQTAAMSRVREEQTAAMSRVRKSKEQR